MDSESDGRPIVVADYADNPGGGAYGDATSLLGVLLAACVKDACFGPMADPKPCSSCSTRRLVRRFKCDWAARPARDWVVDY